MARGRGWRVGVCRGKVGQRRGVGKVGSGRISKSNHPPGNMGSRKGKVVARERGRQGKVGNLTNSNNHCGEVWVG